MAYSTISYNGVEISEPWQMLEYREFPIYDTAKNFLRSRHILHVRGTYNPATTSIGPPPAIEPKPGIPPAQTVQNIRHVLEQSRGVLIYQPGLAASSQVLRSPAVGFSVDANNGPVTVVHNVFERRGQKTYAVDFTVSTDINETGKWVAKPPIVTSHTFRMQNVVGQDGLTRRIIIGTIICRSDLLQQANAIPDDFRQALTFPVPTNFQRQHVISTASEDGISCEYTVVDVERFVNLVPASIVEVRSSYDQVYTMTGAAEITQRAFQLVGRKLVALGVTGANYASRAAQISATAGANPNPIQAAAVAAIANAANAAAAATAATAIAAGAALNMEQMAYDVAPRMLHRLNVQMWGNRSISASGVQKATVAFVKGRYGQIKGISPGICASASLGSHVSYEDNSAVASITFQTGPLGLDVFSLTGGPGTAAAALIAGIAAFPNVGLEYLDADAGTNAFVTTGNAANPPLLGGKGTGGDYLGAVVASMLQAENSPPVAPGTQYPGNLLVGGRQRGNLAPIGGPA